MLNDHFIVQLRIQATTLKWRTLTLEQRTVFSTPLRPATCHLYCPDSRLLGHRKITTMCDKHSLVMTVSTHHLAFLRRLLCFVKNLHLWRYMSLPVRLFWSSTARKSLHMNGDSKWLCQNDGNVYVQRATLNQRTPTLDWRTTLKQRTYVERGSSPTWLHDILKDFRIWIFLLHFLLYIFCRMILHTLFRWNSRN